MAARKPKASVGWQAEAIERVRALIREADPEAVEEVKWRKPSNPDGIPVWSHDGIVCTGETYKEHVRFTFAKGGSVPDPDGLFDPDGAGNARRAIVLKEGDRLDARAFKSLFRRAVALNEVTRAKRPAARRRRSA